MIDDDSDASPKKRPQHRHDSSDSEDEEAKQPEQPRKATTARVVVDITRARDLSEEHGLPNPFCVLSIVQLRDGRRLSDARRTRVAKHRTSNLATGAFHLRSAHIHKRAAEAAHRGV